MPLVSVVNELHSDDAFLWLLTFSEYDSDVVLRAVSNLEDITSRGNVYTAFPFDVTLPTDDGTKPPEVKVVFPNVGRELMKLVREFAPSQPPSVKFELVLSSDPDVVEKTIDFLEIASVDYDALAISFLLNMGNMFGRKTCHAIYSQYEFPGLFYAVR